MRFTRVCKVGYREKRHMWLTLRCAVRNSQPRPNQGYLIFITATKSCDGHQSLLD